MKIAILFLAAFISLSCTNKEGEKGAYYYDFDEVVHYKMYDEDEIRTILTKEVQTKRDSLTEEFLTSWGEISNVDNKIIAKLDSSAFKRQDISKSENIKLREIFREKYSSNTEESACAPTYRDIYIFKKNNQVVGMGKLCYDCGISEFTNTTAYTKRFGDFGEFGELKKISNN